MQRTKIDLERGCSKIDERTELMNEWIKEWKKGDWTFRKSVQVELLLTREGKVKEISPDGCSFMIEEGIDPIGKTMDEIQWAGDPRVVGWYDPKEVVKYRAITEEQTVITVSELKYIMPFLELEESL